MKTKIILLIAFLALNFFSLWSQQKTEKFEVKGQCEMCKKRIEYAAKSVKGVTFAHWNQNTKILEVSYDESKTNNDKIQKKIARIGHDTPLHKANDQVYHNLHECCKYERSIPVEKRE